MVRGELQEGFQGLLGHGEGVLGAFQVQGELQEALGAAGLLPGLLQGLKPGEDHPRGLGQGLDPEGFLGEKLPRSPCGVQAEDPDDPFRGAEGHAHVGPLLPLSREEDHPGVLARVGDEEGFPLLHDRPGDALAFGEAEAHLIPAQAPGGHQLQNALFRAVKEEEDGGGPGLPFGGVHHGLVDLPGGL